MFSVVLMAALATGSSTPGWHWGNGCQGGSKGCHGGCNGCYGGGYGCYGSGYGCYGGCSGCYGGCRGSYSGCWGCNGGCYGSYTSPYQCHGCYGCYGCFGCSGYTPVPLVPSTPAAPSGPAEKIPAPKPEEKKASASTAKLIVDMPADAQLYVDDQVMKTTSAQRVFNTPALEQGQTYFYMLRVEMMRDGKPQTETKRVLVRAGEVTRASFTNPDPVSTVSARSESED